jgi:cytochrome c oxidase subunit 3
MLISSGALWQANQQFKLENYERYKNYLAATIILGVLFLAMQVIGAYEMWVGGIKWQHISGAFLFLLGGLHAVHILGGIIWMVVIYFQAVSKRTYVDSFIQSLNPLTAIRLKLLGWYWHFVDFLWIYLFLVFLLSNAF